MTSTRTRPPRAAWWFLGLSSLLLLDCKKDDVEDAVDEVAESEVRGRVVDDRGAPVANATVRLFDLAENTSFVEGADISAAAAYIDREAVLASTNGIAEAQTNAEGAFVMKDVRASAFLAVAIANGCSAGFAGFDESTGVLNLNTLIVPQFDDGLIFTIPDFVLACATPPPVGPDGNSEEAPPFDPPPPPPPTCDEEACVAAGGTCVEDACVVTCALAACEASGGTCVDGACELPACDAAACEAAGGACAEDGTCVIEEDACDEAVCGEAGGTCSEDGATCDLPPCLATEPKCTDAGGACSEDGTTCLLPACSSDEDCAAAQPGATCADPGDAELATCVPPDPGEIVPPPEPLGWTSFVLTDGAGTTIADASTESQAVPTASIPADGLVRVTGTHDGGVTTAFVQIQSGGTACPNLPPRTDFIGVELVDGTLTTSEGPFLPLCLSGGSQKIQLTTAEALGEGDRSAVIEIGEPCAPPAHAFIATLTWDAGPGEPADLDLNVWNVAGELVFVGQKDAAWGQLALEGKGPGPEVFVSDDPTQGPFLIKVQFFSGKPRDIEAKLRIQRTVGGQAVDESFTVLVQRPKDVAEVGVFAAE